MAPEPETRLGELHWSERLVLTVRTAAAVLDRDEHWIRSQMAAGRLEAVQLTPAGSLMVKTESLVRLVLDARAATHAQLSALKRRTPEPPALRLVVNNTS